MCFTLSLMMLCNGFMKNKKTLVIFLISSGITECWLKGSLKVPQNTLLFIQSSLYTKCWAITGLIIIWFFSSTCPRFKMIQCCSLVIVITHSWYTQVQEKLHRTGGTSWSLEATREVMALEGGNGLAQEGEFETTAGGLCPPYFVSSPVIQQKVGKVSFQAKIPKCIIYI